MNVKSRHERIRALAEVDAPRTSRRRAGAADSSHWTAPVGQDPRSFGRYSTTSIGPTAIWPSMNRTRRRSLQFPAWTKSGRLSGTNRPSGLPANGMRGGWCGSGNWPGLLPNALGAVSYWSSTRFRRSRAGPNRSRDYGMRTGVTAGASTWSCWDRLPCSCSGE